MNNEVFTSAPHAGPVHLCSQCNPVGLAGLRHPDQALLMGVTVCGVCGLKEVLEAHDTVGGRTATAAADGDAGAVAAIVKTFGEGRYEVFADCGRELVRDQWNKKYKAAQSTTREKACLDASGSAHNPVQSPSAGCGSGYWALQQQRWRRGEGVWGVCVPTEVARPTR